LKLTRSTSDELLDELATSDVPLLPDATGAAVVLRSGIRSVGAARGSFELRLS
jgi:hypothetical protein